MSLPRNLLIAALAAGTLAACGKKDADDGLPDTTNLAPTAQAPTVPRVSSIELGRATDSTNNIMGGVTSAFGVTDTFHLAVRTENTAPGAMLTARWMAASGTTIDSTSQAVASSATNSAVTAFHLSKGSAWPAGVYRVEVFLDGASQGIKEFEVRQ